MTPSRFLLLAVALVVSLGACGEEPPERGTPRPDASASDLPAAAASDLYEATATVLESEEHGPELCLGAVLDSLPPQCDGVPVEGWDWADVGGEESRGGTTWGDFHVVGRYDGDSFSVTEAGPPKPSHFDDDPIGTPCDEPAGGWAPVDAALASHEHASRAAQTARKEPDFSGVWFDYYGETDPDAQSDAEAYGDIILNVAFTNDLDRHERELREIWGGPLCLQQHERTYRELLAIQNDLTPEGARELDLEILGSSTSEVNGTVEIEVVVVHPDTQERLDERYGDGVVVVRGRLAPVR